MYGFRARLGFLLAPGNSVFENEVLEMLPHGVTAHFTRIPLRKVTRDDYVNWTTEIEQHSKVFVPTQVKCIGIANAMGSFMIGREGDLNLMKRVREATGVGCTTVMSSILFALRKLGATKICLVLPYENEEFDALLGRYFNHDDMTVMEKQNLSISGDELWSEVSKQDPLVTYELGMRLAKRDIDAIVSPNTNLRSVEIIENLENDAGKPVVTGTQSLVWSSLRLAGITDKIGGKGKIFELSDAV